MKKYKYIIVGGGMTGSAAVKEIRKNDPEGSIAVFSKEHFKPYKRPPLTKGLWSGKKVDDIAMPVEKYAASLFLDSEIVKISPQSHEVVDNKGNAYQYEKCLLATGGNPITLRNAPEGIIYYRTLADFEILKKLTETKSDFCIIGGGFIGSEIAVALNNHGKQATLIFPEQGISGVRFPDDLSEFLNDYYQEKGVTIINQSLVEAIEKIGDKYYVHYKNVFDGSKSEGIFDAVIVGIGIRPDFHLAQDAGLQTGDGIIVNEYLQTSDPDIFAAGDVSYFPIDDLGMSIRVEHEDHALSSGRVAGQNMTGAMEKYDHFPFFYSDLFDLGYEAIGILDKSLDIVEDWIVPFKKGTIFYLDEGKIRGLIFWGLWEKVDEGRKLIREGKTYQHSDLIGLFK